MQQRKREREGARAERNKKGKKTDATDTEKQSAKLEEDLMRLATEKDALENELANASAEGNVSQLKRLNQSYAKIQKEHAGAEQALEDFIARL